MATVRDRIRRWLQPQSELAATSPIAFQVIAGQIFDLGRLLKGQRDRNEAVIRSLCVNAYLGDGVALCRVLGRYKVYLDTRDIGVSSHLLLDGFWEMWVTEAIIREIRQGMTVLDIGAHCGYFTLLMSDLVGDTGTVHAFEPNPAMAPRLRDTVAVNGFGNRTTVHTVALGDRDGGAQLIIPEGEPKNAHVVHDGAHQGNGTQIIERRLDSFEDIRNVSVIKIDVEGAEENVWRGMAGLLDAGQPLTIFLEFTPGRYENPARFLNKILSYGFSLHLVQFVGGVMPVTREDVLNADPREDQMLVLRR